MCFRPEIARDVLKFVGVQFAQLEKTDHGYLIKCNHIGSGFDSNQNLLYYPVLSNKCREIFPEIQLSQKIWYPMDLIDMQIPGIRNFVYMI